MNNILDAYDYTDQLNDKIKENGTVIQVSKEFNDIQDNAEKVVFLEQLLLVNNLMPSIEDFKKPKDDAISNTFRNEGNTYYKQQKFIEALECYNKSLAFAEVGSENVGLAYSNRSAVFCAAKLYKRALSNINLAVENKYPQDKIDKLLQRKELCEDNVKLDVEESDRQILGQEYFKLSHDVNQNVPFIAKCLEIKNDDQFGRYVVTNKKLSPGEIVAIEEPFSKALLPKSNYRFCINCLNHNFLDLLPCEGCTSVMFCSEHCREEGMKKFHKFECKIIDVLNAVYTKIMRIASHTFYDALYIYNSNVQQLASAMTENENSSTTIFDLTLKMESDNAQKKKVFMAVDSLVTNEKYRSKADFFQRAGIVAIMTHLLLKYSSLGEVLETENDKQFYRRFIIKQTQIAALNYHGIFDGIITQSELNDHVQNASGSYPFCSLINHSCVPNVVRVSYNCKNYIMVNRLINAGEQLFDNYGYHHCLESRNERQVSLKNQYMFKCTCLACQHDYPLFPNLISRVQSSSIPNDHEIAQLQSLNLEVAKKKFGYFANTLEALDSKGFYPCREISALQETLLQCFFIFKMTKFNANLLKDK